MMHVAPPQCHLLLSPWLQGVALHGVVPLMSPTIVTMASGLGMTVDARAQAKHRVPIY